MPRREPPATVVTDRTFAANRAAFEEWRQTMAANTDSAALAVAGQDLAALVLEARTGVMGDDELTERLRPIVTEIFKQGAIAQWRRILAIMNPDEEVAR